MLPAFSMRCRRKNHLPSYAMDDSFWKIVRNVEELADIVTQHLVRATLLIVFRKRVVNAMAAENDLAKREDAKRMSEKGPEECPICQSRNACLAFADLEYCPYESGRFTTLQPPSPASMLQEIVGHLGACQIQRVASDDRIIANHIDVAYALATSLLRAQRMSESPRPHDISLQEAHWSGR